ncbi:MAG: 50S ribosomal protein L34e [DPANN group archaeon]|nr:50S ribosomal protein L34e [DPANN group archaeon]
MQLTSYNKKKIRRRTPGGASIVAYKYKRHSAHKCGICKKELHGKPSGRNAYVSNLSKSQRTVERPFGGMLCSKCSRNIISLKAKLKHGIIAKAETPISLKRYLQ